MNQSEMEETKRFLKKIGAPDLETLPEDWQKTVGVLASSMEWQARALMKCEKTMILSMEKAAEGDYETAFRTLTDGYCQVERFLSGDNSGSVN